LASGVKLPRPLIIVLIVIVVIAVVACGATVIRGTRNEQGGDSPANKDELRQGGFADFFSLFAPPSAPLNLGDPGVALSSGCGAPNQFNDLTITSCTITIGATNDVRRELRLDPSSSMTMSVSGQSSGESFNDATGVAPGTRDGSLVLGRGDFATVGLTCLVQCIVHVNHVPPH
jgi:hypothetical protein